MPVLLLLDEDMLLILKKRIYDLAACTPKDVNVYYNDELIKVRSFDVCTFVAFGAAQIGIAGEDVINEFNYSEIYSPLGLNIGHCRISVAALKSLLKKA